MLTIFTPTYNRAHLLPRLYKSLQHQDCFDFEWLVINDGSTDNTEELFSEWLKLDNSFPIRYFKVNNGGKQRAINKALELAEGEYFFIVDSDDMLVPDAVSFVLDSFQTLPSDNSFIGISGVKGDLDGMPLHRIPQIDPETGFIDAHNIERPKYGLQADMAEAFFTAKLKKYCFPVWKGEKFVPEAVVWDQMALDGYKLRWFDKVTYLCEYQPDGLTNSSWRLLKNNPMGYAQLFNIKLLSAQGYKSRFNLILQFLSCCILAGEYRYIGKCHNKMAAYFLFPLGWLLSIRRKNQLQKYCDE